MPLPSQMPVQGQKPANVSQTVKGWATALAERAKAEAEKQLKVGAHDPANAPQDGAPGADQVRGPMDSGKRLQAMRERRGEVGQYAADDFLSQLQACDAVLERFANAGDGQPQRHAERPPPISAEEHRAIVQGMKPGQRRQLELRGFTQTTHPKSGEHGTLTVARGIAYWDPHPPQAGSSSWTRYAFSSADGTESEQTSDFFDDELKRQRDQQRRERQKTMQSTNPTATATLDRNFIEELEAIDAKMNRYASSEERKAEAARRVEAARRQADYGDDNPEGLGKSRNRGFFVVKRKPTPDTDANKATEPTQAAPDDSGSGVDRHGSWSPHHHRVLSALDEAPGAGSRDLAHALGMDRRSVQSILDDLHDDDHVLFANGGYHVRTRDDDDDDGPNVGDLSQAFPDPTRRPDVGGDVDRHGNAPIGRPAWPDDRPRVTVYAEQLKHWGIGRDGQASLESGQRLQTKHPLTGQIGSISKRYANEYIFEPEQAGRDRHAEVPASMRFLVDRLSRFSSEAEQIAGRMLQHEADRAQRHAASLESIDFVPGCYSRNLRVLDAIAKGRYRASREVINRAADDALADLNGTFKHGDTIGDAWRHVINDARQDALTGYSNAMHYRAGVRTISLEDIARHTTFTDVTESEDEVDGKEAAKRMDPDASKPATLDPDKHFFDQLARIDRFATAR